MKNKIKEAGDCCNNPSTEKANISGSVNLHSLAIKKPIKELDINFLFGKLAIMAKIKDQTLNKLNDYEIGYCLDEIQDKINELVKEINKLKHIYTQEVRDGIDIEVEKMLKEKK